MPDSFNNDKNVYILGAGFSKDAGLPLQDDFLLVAKEVFFKNPEKYPHFKKVFEYQDTLTKMKKYLNYPLLNLEHLFNLIEMDLFYSQNSKIQQIKTDFIKLICDVLIDRTPCPFYHDPNGSLCTNKSIFEPYLSFLNLFIKNDNNAKVVIHDDAIISFNYDLVLEGAASIYNWKRNEKYSSVFSKPKDNSLLFNTTFGKTNIVLKDMNLLFSNNLSFYPPFAQPSDLESFVKLYKLHGSINWKTIENIESTFIVPPTWNKSDPEIRQLWEKACQELKTAKRIIVIGYSFPETDIYVKSLLGLALNENQILQNIYFINPDKDDAKRTSLSLLDKYFGKYCEYKEWKFSYFIDSSEGKEFIKQRLNRNIL